MKIKEHSLLVSFFVMKRIDFQYRLCKISRQVGKFYQFKNKIQHLFNFYCLFPCRLEYNTLIPRTQQFDQLHESIRDKGVSSVHFHPLLRLTLLVVLGLFSMLRKQLPRYHKRHYKLESNKYVNSFTQVNHSVMFS